MILYMDRNPKTCPKCGGPMMLIMTASGKTMSKCIRHSCGYRTSTELSIREREDNE